MALKLYYAPKTRSTRPRWVLEELGVPYELERIDLPSGGHKKPEYLKVHPLGAVPAFKDGDKPMIESAAICMYLADKFPEKKLAPAVGTPERGDYYQWIMFGMATMEPIVYTVFQHTVMLAPEKRNPNIADEAKTKYKNALNALSEALKGKQFVVGNQFTVADVVIGSILSWSKAMGMLNDHPDLVAYSKSLAERPAYKKAIAD